MRTKESAGKSYYEYLMVRLQNRVEREAYIEASLEFAIEMNDFTIFLKAIQNVIEANKK